MAQVCSIEASRLAPEDAAEYKTRRKHSTRRAFVELRLREAKQERAMIIAEVQRQYPDLINADGEFTEDLLAAQFEAEAAGQQSAFTKQDRGGTAQVRAALSRRSVADPDVVAADDAALDQQEAAEKLVPDDAFSATMKLYDGLNAIDKQKLKKALGQEKLSGVLDLIEEDPKRVAEAIKDVKKAKKKDRSPKRSAEEVADGEQPRSPGKTGSGTTTDTDPTGEGREARAKKSPQKAEESKPAGQEQPQQAEQPEQQPPSVTYRSAQGAWNSLREQALLNPGREFNFILTWAEMKTGGSFATAIEAWEKLFQTGTPTISDLERIYEGVSDKGPAILGTALDYITTADNKVDFKLGARMLFESTVLRPEDQTGTLKAWQKQAMEYVSGTREGLYSTLEHEAWAKEAFIESAVETITPKTRTLKNGDLDITPPKYTHNGIEKPWVTLAMEMGWLLEVVGQLDVAPVAPSEDMKALFDQQDLDTTAKRIVKDAQRYSERQEMREAATGNLTEMMDRILSGVIEIGPLQQRMYTDAVKSFIADGADMNHIYRGAPLKDWAPNDTLQWEGNNLRRPQGTDSTVQEVTESMDAPPREGRASMVDSGTPITNPYPMGRVRSYIARVRLALRKGLAPRIYIMKDLEDFRKTKPAQYQEAMTSRKGGVPTNAAGFSFGDTVIIFQENIKNKQHLAFVVGHEVLGHHGLAAYMPKARLKKLMDDIYDADPFIRVMADQRMEVEGLDKTEATEEAIADLAGEAEASTIIRMWNAIKTFLNKLGFRFSDDMARYFVNQSRRLVRTGSMGDATAAGIYADLQDLQRRYVEGRASTANLAGRHGWLPSHGNGDGVTSSWATAKRAVNNFRTMEGMDENVRAAAMRWGDVSISIGRGLEMIQSLDNKALRSKGLKMVFDVFAKQTAHVRKVQTILNDKTKFSHRYNFNPFAKVTDPDDWQKGPPPTAEEREHANRLLEQASLYRLPLVTERMIHGMQDLLKVVNGQYVRDEAAIAAAFRAGHVTKAEFEAGLKSQALDDAGRPMEGKDHVYKPDFKITGRVWKIYEEQRAVVAEAAITVYEDKVRGMQGAKDAEFDYIQRTNGLTPEAIYILKDIQEEYSKMYNHKAKLEGKGFAWNSDEIQRAKHFIHHVMRVMDKNHGDAKLQDWINGPTKDKDGKIHPNDEGMVQFLGDEKLLDKLKLLNQTKVSNAMSIRNTMMDMHLLETQLTNARYAALNTLLSSYIPLVRRGRFQVRVEAVNKDGVVIDLADDVKSMLYYTRTEKKSEADVIARELNDEFKTFEPAEVARPTEENERDADGNTIPRLEQGVTFRAVSETAMEVPPMGESINFDAMVNTLMQANIKLREVDREKLVRMTTRQHSTARARLRRSGNPGWDRNIMRGIAEHLEAQSHIAGKNLFRHSLAHIMADKVAEQNIWNGDPKKLQRLQTKYTKALAGTSEATKVAAFKELAEYQHMYTESSSNAVISIMKRDGTRADVAGKGKASQYKSDAAALMEYYDSSMNIADATGEDKLSKMAGPLMSMTAAMQLGGAIAPALINMTSLISHAIPYLSTLNPKTGYGGGHGPGAAAAAIWKAGRDLSLFRGGIKVDVVGSAEALQELVDGAWKDGERKYGMTKDEVVFLQSLTEKGVLTPNMFNALIGTSRTGRQDTFMPRATEAWMFMFAKTEQYNRRVTALASYRLDKQRALAAGTSESTFANPKSDASQRVYESAVRAVDASQGNYSQFNRPPLARGNALQYFYMYKQFIVITIQLMRNLSTKEKLIMLAFLVLASGIKGLPFAEDIADLVDTAMQKFGLPWEGLEANITRLAEALVPGSSRIFIRGLLDYIYNTTISTRLGHGNLVPGTSMFLAGADTARELTDIVGPVASAITGAMGAAALFAQWSAEVVGIKDDVTPFRDVARTGFGFTAVKSLAEGMIFASDGRITNKRGQVVSQDFGPIDMITRILGFYPADATTQYDVDRMGRRADEHGKVLTAGYVKAYREATSAAERTEIKSAVRAWNRDVGRKSPFYIRGFGQKAVRSKREAERTVTARSLKNAPTSVKAFRKEMMRINGLDQKGLPLSSSVS